MALKTTLQKGSPNQSLPIKSLQKQTYGDVLQNRFFRNFPIFTGKHLCWSLFFNKVAGRKASLYLKETWTRVFLWILRNFLIVKPPVASVDLLFLIKSNVGWFLLQRVDLVIVRVIYTLLVETIPTRFYWLTRKNEKLVQNKPLQQRLFDLILGFWHFFYILIANVSWTVAQTPINHIIFWKTVMKIFRSIYVNCFNRLRFLAEVSTKLQKMHFFGQFKDHNSGRKHGN